MEPCTDQLYSIIGYVKGALKFSHPFFYSLRLKGLNCIILL